MRLIIVCSSCYRTQEVLSCSLGVLSCSLGVLSLVLSDKEILHFVFSAQSGSKVYETLRFQGFAAAQRRGKLRTEE